MEQTRIPELIKRPSWLIRSPNDILKSDKKKYLVIR